LSDGRSFGEGLHWGYGFAEVTKRRPRKVIRRGGFKVESAELKHNLIVAKAVNAFEMPARVSRVAVTEIYPEPRERRLGVLVLREDQERLPCKWSVLGLNLINPGETVEVEAKPLRPLREGYAYEITVEREWSSEEMDALMERGPAHRFQTGIPATYLYTNGKLEGLNEEGPSSQG